MRLNKKIILHTLKDYGMITFGVFCYTFGWAAFLLPYEIAAGGLTGIAAITFYATGIPTQLTYFSLNAILLLVALKVLGLKYCVKTMYGVGMVTVLLWLLQEMMKNGGTTLPQILGPGEDFMACIIGSVLCGFGLGQIFIYQGSTGGTDIIAAIVNKYKNVTMGRIILYCDILIISSCYFIFDDWKRVVFGFVTMFVVAFLIDYVMNYAQQSMQFLIITNKKELVSRAILRDANCGATLIPARGCYTGEEKSILLVVAHKRQAHSICRLVHTIDPHAFISQTKSSAVYGEGFDKVKK